MLVSQSVSEREAEVLAALGERLSNAQIARRMHISVRTVESHVSSLLRKLGAADRTALADLAPPGGSVAEIAGLPTTWTSFVGRERELAAVRAACADARLVTITGPGGVGKTRLATAVVADLIGAYPAGGACVDLVSVREGFLVEAIAAKLDVSERPRQSLLDAVLERLRRGRSLVILDNCEHMLTAVTALVDAILRTCPAVTVLATSRERLGLAGERPVPLPPLATASEATALFLDRARAVAPDFTADPESLDALCLRLDRMPLTIELAAARAASLGVDGLLAGLDDHLRLLTGGRGASQRHQSLRAVMDWSAGLLDADERTLFARLGVFNGGFNLDAAVAVAHIADRPSVADLIGRLTDKSLLTRLPGVSRWRMLETVRAYAEEQLDGDPDASGRYIAWATDTARSLVGDETDDWQVRFDTVADDLRCALRLGLETDRAVDPLARDLARLTYVRRFFAEARQHFEQAARLAPDQRTAAHDLRQAADVAMAEMRADAAYDLLLESAELARAAGDANGHVDAVAYAVIAANRFPAEFPKEIPSAELNRLLGSVQLTAEHTDRVAAIVAAAEAWNAGTVKCAPDPQLSEVAVARARVTGDPALISGAMDALGTAYSMSGQLREAHRLSRERLDLVAKMPRRDLRFGIEISDALHMVSVDAIASGDLSDALEIARLVEQDDVVRGIRHYVASKQLLPLALQGHFDEALRYAREVWESWESAGRPAARWMTQAVYAASLVHGLRGDETARQLWTDRSFQVLTSSDTAAASTMKGFKTFGDARIALHRGDLARAVEIAETTGVGGWYDDERWFYDAYAWAVAAEIAVVAGLSDAGARLTAAAPLAEENLWAKACLARAIGRRDGDADALRESVAGWERIGARFERACTLQLLGNPEGARELTAMGCAPPADARRDRS